MPIHGGIAHEKGHISFHIAVFPRVEIEHELGESALQPCKNAFQYDEARAGDRGGELEVHEAQQLADLEMLAHRKGEVLRLALAQDLAIRCFIGAVGNLIQWKIGQFGQACL